MRRSVSQSPTNFGLIVTETIGRLRSSDPFIRRIPHAFKSNPKSIQVALYKATLFARGNGILSQIAMFRQLSPLLTSCLTTRVKGTIVNCNQFEPCIGGIASFPPYLPMSNAEPLPVVPHLRSLSAQDGTENCCVEHFFIVLKQLSLAA